MGYVTYGIIALVCYLYMSYCLREIARKQAFERAWLAWVPVVNIYVLCRVAGKGLLWTVLALVPVVNIVIYPLLFMKLARARGRSRWYGLLLVPPLVNFIVMWDLAFGLRAPGDRTLQGATGAR